MAHTERDELIQFLDRRAFGPVLDREPEAYTTEADQRKLRSVQETTRAWQQRYHRTYHTPEDVRNGFRHDLTSEEAQVMNRDLRDLGLPTLLDVRDEFEQLADRLGVGA